MKITVDVSMYPLDADYKPPIKAFIRRLREFSGIQVLSNQMSTQINGDYADVSAALNKCMHEAMQQSERVVFTVRYLNADLPIARLPDIDGVD